MLKQNFIDLGIDEDLASKLELLSLEELNNFVPLSDFDELKSNSKNNIKNLKSQLLNLKLDFAIELALREFNAINFKTVIPLIQDLDNAQFDEFGKIIGLDAQLLKLSTDDSTSFLFHKTSPANSTPSFSGACIGQSGNDACDLPHSYSSISRLMQQNPNQFL